jgi:hypothetical protein
MKGLTFIKFKQSIQVLHAAWGTSTSWIPFGIWAYGEETCQCSGSDVFIMAMEMDIRSKVQLVFSLLSLQLFSLLYDTLLRLYGLRSDVLFSLIA